MKKLLNESAQVLIERINNGFTSLVEEIKETNTIEEAFRVMKKRRNEIESIINKLEYIKKQMEIRYPENTKEIIRLERFVSISRLQLELEII